MSASIKKLQALLFDEGRALVNIKFFPGDKAQTVDQLADAAHDMLCSALKDGREDKPPMSGQKRASIAETFPA